MGHKHKNTVAISNSELEAAQQKLPDNRIGMENEYGCGQRKAGMA